MNDSVKSDAYHHSCDGRFQGVIVRTRVCVSLFISLWLVA